MATETLSRWKQFQKDALALWDEKLLGGEGDTELMWWHKFIRFWIFVGRSFVRNRCPVRASSLAYTTLLGLVPVLAVAISISTSLLKTEKGEKQIEEVVNAAVDKFAPQLGLTSGAGGEDHRKRITQVISASIKQVESGTLGATAGLIFICVAISLLASIENTLNDIWGVARGRTWFTRTIYYWAVVTFGPILLLFALGLQASRHVDVVKGMLERFPYLSVTVYEFLPVALLVIGFSAFYFLMPNTKVEWRAALIGGLVAGLLIHANNAFSSIYFGQVVRNSKLWGGLGTVPVFLVGLYFSWLILLFGAQIAYAYQNRRSYFQEKQAENINQRGREFVAFRIMMLLAKRFDAGQQPLTVPALADELAVPSRLIRRTLEPLLLTRLAIEVAPTKLTGAGFTPGRPLKKISCQDILDAMRAGVGQEVATKDDHQRAAIREKFDCIREAERQVAASMTLQDMVELQKAPNPAPVPA